MPPSWYSMHLLKQMARYRARFQWGEPFVLRRILYAGIAFSLFTGVSPCQQFTPDGPPETAVTPGSESSNSRPNESKRILGIIPNYRTSPTLDNYEPLTSGEKFKLASQDSFDRGTVVLAALFAGQGQLSNANRPFGQGVAGYCRYFGAAYGDFLIGNYMTEAIFPTVLHQDPRYFRRGTGSGWSRLRYAVGEIFWTRRDSGGTQFNFSEVVGNSTAAAISTAYYADNRSAASAASNLGIQIGVDTATHILQEFWPDLERKFSRKHHRQDKH
jgi:hypothetical protein